MSFALLVLTLLMADSVRTVLSVRSPPPLVLLAVTLVAVDMNLILLKLFVCSVHQVSTLLMMDSVKLAHFTPTRPIQELALALNAVLELK